MAIRIAIVDDEPSERTLLSDLVARYSRDNHVELLTRHYPDGRALVASGAAEDIVLLDIEMGEVDGMRVAHALRDVGVSSEIIFVTNMAQYAIRGYEVGALDFVVKPVRYPAFAFKLRRAIDLVRRKRSSRVTIESRGGIHTVDTTDIRYVEVRGHRLVYHTTRADIEAWGTMRETAAALGPYGFALCNVCFLVNLDRVTRLEGETVWVDDIPLKMSRGRRRDFVNALTPPQWG